MSEKSKSVGAKCVSDNSTGGKSSVTRGITPGNSVPADENLIDNFWIEHCNPFETSRTDNP